MNDLWSEIRDHMQMLDEAVNELAGMGRELAQAEASYKAALSVKILQLREEQKLPATLIQDIARGDSEISLLRLHRDCAEADYKSHQELVNAHKLELRILNDQFAREWSQAK